jgi:hypothetical protein
MKQPFGFKPRRETTQRPGMAFVPARQIDRRADRQRPVAARHLPDDSATRLSRVSGRGSGNTPSARHHRVPEEQRKLEIVQHIANHESPRTMKFYDRRQDEISLDEVKPILI